MFGSKEFDSITPKYPTPEDIPLESACRTFTVPSSSAWLGLLMGMLMQGLDPENWQQLEGGITPEAAADEWAAIFNSGYDEGGICSTQDRPYWDDNDADDTGDSETDGFPWYEDAADWTVGAFLASAGLGGAAFEFVTIARQFRLAFRKRDYGAIVNIFLDGELQATVDTYSPTPAIEYVDIFTPEAVAGSFSALVDPSYTLRVEHSGDHNPLAEPMAGRYWLEAIRKRLSPAEVYPENLRYNPETDEVEYTPDGGVTWHPAPEADPRTSTIFLMPPNAATDKRCQAAANIVRFISDLVTQVIALMASVSSAAGLIALLIGLFAVLGPWAVLITLFAALASIMFDAGITALTVAFAGPTYDALLCILYCNLDSSGRAMDPAIMAAIREDLDASTDINALGKAVLNAMIDLMGPVGLSNAGAQGEAPADCDTCDCGWCYQWDFLTDDGGYSAFFYASTWSSGIGWQAGNATAVKGTAISLTFSARPLTEAAFQWIGVKGGGSGQQATVFLFLGGVLQDRVDTSWSDGDSGWSWGGDGLEADQVVFAVQTSNSGFQNGSADVYLARLRGLEDNPFGEDNCE